MNTITGAPLKHCAAKSLPGCACPIASDISARVAGLSIILTSQDCLFCPLGALIAHSIMRVRVSLPTGVDLYARMLRLAIMFSIASLFIFSFSG